MTLKLTDVPSRSSSSSCASAWRNSRLPSYRSAQNALSTRQQQLQQAVRAAVPLIVCAACASSWACRAHLVLAPFYLLLSINCCVSLRPWVRFVSIRSLNSLDIEHAYLQCGASHMQPNNTWTCGPLQNTTVKMGGPAQIWYQFCHRRKDAVVFWARIFVFRVAAWNEGSSCRTINAAYCARHLCASIGYNLVDPVF